MGKKREVKVGEIFGQLTVLGESPSNFNKLVLRCSCGTVIEAMKGSVYSSENTRSCGCARKVTLIRMKTTHGMREHELYGSWADMRKRCHNPKSKSYKNYGGRGITICSRWDNFVNFVEDMGSRPYAGATLDRKDNNGNYEPSNCKWSNAFEQVTNRRLSLRYVYKEVEYTMQELAIVAKPFGVEFKTLRDRINKGIPVNLAVETPLARVGGHPKPNDGRSLVTRVGVKLKYSPVVA